MPTFALLPVAAVLPDLFGFSPPPQVWPDLAAGPILRPVFRSQFGAALPLCKDRRLTRTGMSPMKAEFTIGRRMGVQNPYHLTHLIFTRLPFSKLRQRVPFYSFYRLRDFDFPA